MTSSPSKSREQFNAQADQYASSEVHRFGPSLPVLIKFAAPTPSDKALDVATGTGNTALAIAPHVAHVTGLDMAEKMLAHAQNRANEEGQRNSLFVRGSAEELPFPDEAFTLVTSRHAPHHFSHLERFIAEAYRVLKTGGRLVIADQISPTPELQDWIDRYQRLRDPSHHVQRTVQEWQELTQAAGLTWTEHKLVPYRLDFAWWTKQSGSTPETVQALREMVQELGPNDRQAIGAEFDEHGQLTAHIDQMMVVRLEKI